MNKTTALHMFTCALSFMLAACSHPVEHIDREAVVRRHTVVTDHTLGKSPAQVGNGRFAFGMDITGLQTFTAFNTLSDWGWHSCPLPEGKQVSDYSPVMIETHGRSIPYILDNPDEPEITAWLKWNPHRVHLGRIGFVLLRSDGAEAAEGDLADCRQTVDLWTGLVSSHFVLDGHEVDVRTSCHPDQDRIAVKVSSELIKEGRLKVFIDFPYAENKSFAPFVGDYEADDMHKTEILYSGHEGATIRHTMDDFSYLVSMAWTGSKSFERTSGHRFEFTPEAAGSFSFLAGFTPEHAHTMPPQAGAATLELLDADTEAEAIEELSRASWEAYWMSGAAVDLSGSKDQRWHELERRIVLSQYLMRLNESGLYPPQEAGLVNNGWHGRFHWEMIWWHGVHYGLWNRMEYFDRYLGVYSEFMPEAVSRAASEGRRGAKWPKCTGDFNREWPCEPHAMLIWQQPHPIYFAEMAYRIDPSQETLDKWKDIVTASADYLADYVFKDGRRYVVGPPVVPVSENTNYMETLNPAFEVEYIHYGLKTAIEWAKRTGMPSSRIKTWKKVLKHLADLPVEDGVYVTYEGIPEMWTKYNYEHPALLGIYGWLPGDDVDLPTFRRTFDKVMEVWQLDKAWGWDYAVLAMAAARMGDAATAIDLLTTTEHKFNFDERGLADVWPFPYFPANGGLLTTIAMMCEGWDGSEGHAPGFPSDGSWDVRYEGFNKMQ